MARPRKEGMDYFPHDAHAAADEKLEAMLMLHGAKGYAFFFLHLEYLYRRDNLAVKITKPFKAVMCAKMQITEDEYDQVLQTALECGLFDAERYAATNELFSHGVLKRAGVVFDEREKERERKNRNGKQQGSPENGGSPESSGGFPPENESYPEFSGLKESKGKERKEKDFPPLTPPPGGGADDALPDSEPEEAKPPPPAPRNACPHEAIIALYHESLPECPHVKVWPEASRKQLTARWREDPERQNLDWWRDMFEQVARSDFLTGRAPTTDGRSFTASLTWLVKPTNLAKVLNGNYTNRASPPGDKRPQYPQPMTAQQRYMRELGDALNAIEEAKHDNNQPNPGLDGTRALLAAPPGALDAPRRPAPHLRP